MTRRVKRRQIAGLSILGPAFRGVIVFIECLLILWHYEARQMEGVQ